MKQKENIGIFMNPINWKEYETKEYGNNSTYKQRLYNIFDYINNVNGKLLDLGSGDGKTGIWLAQKYSDIEVHLIDSDVELLDMSESINPCTNVTKFIYGDISQLEAHTIQHFYDIVTCFDVIEHMNHQSYLNMINGIWHSLKPKGIVVVLCGVSVIPQHIHRLVPEQLIFDFETSGKFLLKDRLNILDLNNRADNACLVFESIKL